MHNQQGYADWWDNPGAGNGDTPVIRHAPDANNYHIPDYEMLSKMRGSQVGKFAVIPAANRDGTSKGFNADEAGLVHVDPDAPDGGVIVDPKQLSNSKIHQALGQSYYPHQAFYKLGTPAPLLGYRKGRFYNQQPHADFYGDPYEQQQEQVPLRNPVMGTNTYVTPRATHDGRQRNHLTEIPNIVGNEMVPLPKLMNPYAQEEPRVQPAPSLSSLAPLNQPATAPAPAPPPQMQGVPQMQPMQVPKGPLAQQVPMYPPAMQVPPGYGYPAAAPAPYQMPGMDPNFQAMMAQQMAAMQNQLAAFMAQQQERPATTGMSHTPLPKGPPQGLRNMPVEAVNRGTRGYTPAYQPEDEDEFDDSTARPINKQVKRNKKTQEIVEEDEAPPRRRSMVTQEREARSQTVQQVRRAQAEDYEPEQVIMGFESLEIDWLNGPVAVKPKKLVWFEIPGAGKHKAYFHGVSEEENCVTLQYDTRYEAGMQYLPPDLGQQVIRINVPHLKKTFNVFSMGFNSTIGVIDQTLLPKAGDEGVDLGEQEA